MRSVIRFAVLALAAAIIVPRTVMQNRAAETARAPAMLAARSTTPADSGGAGSHSVLIHRSPSGHFEVEGRVDGRSMQFMVDTGASAIALTEHDAAMLGIHPTDSDYRAEVKTANGIVRAAPVRLDRVEIEDIEVRDVDALVLPDSALSDNLLGMSFLNRLRRFEVSGGKLVLEQ